MYSHMNEADWSKYLKYTKSNCSKNINKQLHYFICKLYFLYDGKNAQHLTKNRNKNLKNSETIDVTLTDSNTLG